MRCGDLTQMRPFCVIYCPFLTLFRPFPSLNVPFCTWPKNVNHRPGR